jgi:hypothetical protein
VRRVLRRLVDVLVIGVFATLALICLGYLAAVFVVFLWVVLGLVTFRG